MISKQAIEILKMLPGLNRDDLQEILFAAETELFELDIMEGRLPDSYEDFMNGEKDYE